MDNSTCDGESDSICEQHTRIYLETPEDILHPSSINQSFFPIVLTHAIIFLLGVIGNTVVIVTWAGSKPNR